MPVSSNGTITAPVSIRDIQRALGTSIPDLGRLCRHSKINMWAKYKPVKKAMIDTTGQLKSDKTWKPINGTGGLGTDAWYRGVINASTNTDFGIKPKTIAKMGTDSYRMIDALEEIARTWNNGGLNGWVYEYPTGGSTEPYRILDFNHYYHDAPNPVKKVSGDPNVMTHPDAIWEYGLQIIGPGDTLGGVDSRDYLLASDIIGTCYLGIAIYCKINDGLRDVYKVMAWATGTYWEGEGLDVSGRATPIIPTPTATEMHAVFCKNLTYYALPVFFSEQLPQEHTVVGQVKRWPGYSIQPSTNFKVWPIPFVSMIPFTMYESDTKQRYGKPSTTSHTLGSAGYIATLYLDRSSSYYTAYGSVNIKYALVNELWNETIDVSNWPSGSYVGYNSITANVPDNRNDYIIVSNWKVLTVQLGTGHTWKLVIIVANELDEPILLRQDEIPEAPTT